MSVVYSPDVTSPEMSAEAAARLSNQLRARWGAKAEPLVGEPGDAYKARMLKDGLLYVKPTILQPGQRTHTHQNDQERFNAMTAYRAAISRGAVIIEDEAPPSPWSGPELPEVAAFRAARAEGRDPWLAYQAQRNLKPVTEPEDDKPEATAARPTSLTAEQLLSRGSIRGGQFDPEGRRIR
jgi:hypothetical protein